MRDRFGEHLLVLLHTLACIIAPRQHVLCISMPLLRRKPEEPPRLAVLPHLPPPRLRPPYEPSPPRSFEGALATWLVFEAAS